MIKIILITLFLTTTANAKPPLPVKKAEKIEFSKKDLFIIYQSTEFIIDLEGFTPSFITDFNGKIKIIGYGDCICFNRYQNNPNVIITKQEAKMCVLEWNVRAYRKLKKALPNLTISQYVGTLAYIFNRGNSYYESNLFYLTKLKQYKKYIYVKKAKIDLDIVIAKEWASLCNVKGYKKCPQGMVNRRQKELNMFFKKYIDN